jgi:hypothetical protein
MTNLERFWLDLIDGRKYHIQTLYGTEAMQRYRPHPREKERFLENNGRVEFDAEVADYNQRFFDFCEERYADRKAAYLKRIADNGRKAKSWPLYKDGANEREAIKQKMRDVILGHAKETQHQDRRQGQQAAQQETQSQETADPRAAQKESR